MSDSNLRIMSLILLTTLLFAVFIDGTAAAPNGATIVSNSTETPAVQAAGSIATAGGSFTTLILNTTSQNPRWKAYVGNISGDITLSDSVGEKIYDWDITTISGEVYASRNNSVSWGGIQCAQLSIIEAEDVALNITNTNVDSINNTFNETVHQSFFVGTTQIANSTCRALTTFVNSSRQARSESADFQEILLDDTANLVYVTILENDAQGYNVNKTFDFQLILAEDELESTPTTYYFYAELS